MNRHFEDSRYYLGRTVKTAVEGIRTELEPLTDWVRERTGRTVEEEPDRLERLQARAKELEAKAETEARERFETVRERVRPSR